MKPQPITPAYPPKGRRNLTAVKGVLRSAMRRYGLEERFAKYEFVAHWDEIVGSEIAKRAKPDRIQNRTLYVRVANSLWAQELAFQKHVILSRLKKYLDAGQSIDDLHFFLDPDM